MNDLDLYDEIFIIDDHASSTKTPENATHSSSAESSTSKSSDDENLQAQKSINRRLARNFSILLQTAKRELASKDEIIRSLKNDIEQINLDSTENAKLKQKYEHLKLEIDRLKKARDSSISKKSEIEKLKSENESLRKKLKNFNAKVVKFRQSKSKPNLVEITFTDAQDAQKFLKNLSNVE